MPDWLAPTVSLLATLGVGAVLKALVDWLLNRRHNNLKLEAEEHKLETDEKESLRQDVNYLRREMELLRDEVVTLKGELRAVEGKLSYVSSVLRQRDDIYYRAVVVVRDEPDATLRVKLRELLNMLEPLVKDWFREVEPQSG